MILGIRVVTFPREDAAFARTVEEAFRLLDTPCGLASDKIVRVMQKLLPRYPDVEIRQQKGLASFEADPNTWYVYRDGSR